MTLYNTGDVQLFEAKMPDIIKKLGDQEKELFGTKQSEVKTAWDIIIKYVKDNKRKLYGGYALNLLIKNKDKGDAIYKDDEYPDMDTYSPDPITDLITLCNMLADAGLRDVQGREAQHKETYTLSIDGIGYCDFSYVPKLIYNKIPFVQIDGFYVSAPEFITVDYLRAFTDPTTSSFRWDKMFKRFNLLQKHYPIKIKTQPKIENKIIDPLFSKYFEKIITNKKTLLVFGTYAYNIYVKMSGIHDIKPLPIQYFELFSTNYVDDVLEIMNDLKSLVKDESKITQIEYYPFFQFYGFSVHILYDGVIVAKIYSHSGKCRPFVTIDKARVGSFQFNVMMEYIKASKARVDGDHVEQNMCYYRIVNMCKMRKYYFDKNDKNFLNDTIFKDFVVDCIGITLSAKAEKKMRIEKNKKKGRPLAFKYEPTPEFKKTESTYKFANSAGTPIKNTKNFRINKKDKKDNKNNKDTLGENNSEKK